MSGEKILVLKVTFQETTKKIPLSNEDITYDELILMMSRVFKNSFDSTESMSVKYLDEEKDWITVNDTEDLQFAISSSNNYLKVLIERSKPVPEIKHNLISSFSNELKELQKCIQHFSIKLAGMTPEITEVPKPEAKQVPSPVFSVSQKSDVNSFDPLSVRLEEGSSYQTKSQPNEISQNEQSYYQTPYSPSRLPLSQPELARGPPLQLEQHQLPPTVLRPQQTQPPLVPPIYPSRPPLRPTPPQFSRPPQAQVSSVPPQLRHEYNQGPIQISSSDNPALAIVEPTSGYMRSYSNESQGALSAPPPNLPPGLNPPNYYRQPQYRPQQVQSMERPPPYGYPYGYPPVSQAMPHVQGSSSNVYPSGPQGSSHPPQ